MISAILIYGPGGEILVSKIYKDGLRRAVTETFRVQVISNADICSPILTMGSTSFLHIKVNELFIVAVTRYDINALAAFEMLYKFVDIAKQQFGSFNESTCYRYVSEIHEILDEIVDYGILQNTEANCLRLCSNPDDNVGKNGFFSADSDRNGILPSSKRSLSKKPPVNSPRSHSFTDNTSPWRRSEIKYRRNEISLDIIEKLSTVFAPNGGLLSAIVDGHIKIRSQLSGMPTCRVNLNHFDVLENSQFHACVDREEVQSSGKIQFIPPDGEFELLRYRVSRGLKIPFTLMNKEHEGGCRISLRSELDANKYITDIVLLMPLAPTSTSNSQQFHANLGKAKFSTEKCAIKWKIYRLGDSNEAVLSVNSDQPLVGHGPIQIKFAISMYTSSSLRIDSVQVTEDTKYSTLKWVRYLTESGSCEARTA